MGPFEIVVDWNLGAARALDEIGFGLCNDDDTHGIGSDTNKERLFENPQFETKDELVRHSAQMLFNFRLILLENVRFS
ncbi:hypothetical protein AVEN_26936-1 [Araneus ventricosus]|uniref:Uncharacterized protein n=1 Tax=Araneus ventricosus TaxID=182803 RepID=A0A4Y2RYZ5_ARAVE|nr:hypothetical protein AVEN_26936-1 [Araneus ventricosus]